MGLNNAQLNDIFVKYATTRHDGDLEAILLADDLNKHYPVLINAISLFEACMEVSYELLHKPLKVLACFDAALVKSCTLLYENHQLRNEMTLKLHVHARVYGLPVCPELTRGFLPRSDDVGFFLSFSGTVIRTTLVKLLESEKEYFCNKCKYNFVAKADLEKYYVVNKPSICPNPERCNSFKFTASDQPDPNVWRDYQEIKIQERMQTLNIRTIPRTMWIILENDLVDWCKPGDDITLVGTVMRRWRPCAQESKCEIELIIKANFIQVNNDNRSQLVITNELKKEFSEFWEQHKNYPLVGRNKILQSFCPQIYGLYQVKLAVALVLAGGVPKVDEAGTKIRGESHLLLIGDPGTGKSQFLKYAAKIFPRSVLTTGIGSTSAGLTVTAVKDDGEWQLEAGALVLADGGLCCIDEFNSIKEHDRASILEAMEQQTISVAKAGLVCKMNSRCTILASTNPKGHYDPDASVAVNVALASPLLSRFDLILVLLDTKNDAWDRLISSYILEGGDLLSLHNVHSVRWNMDKMQCYYCLIKSLKPVMMPDAHTILQQYYLHHRRMGSFNAARTTVRMLESLIRLSEAHAKLMFRTEVTVLDAVSAVAVMESSMESDSFLNDSSVLHSTFPDDPDGDYQLQAELILKKLELDDILEKELRRLNKQSIFQNETLDRSTHINKSITINENYSTTNDMSSSSPPEQSYVNVEMQLDNKRSKPQCINNNETSPTGYEGIAATLCNAQSSSWTDNTDQSNHEHNLNGFSVKTRLTSRPSQSATDVNCKSSVFSTPCTGKRGPDLSQATVTSDSKRRQLNTAKDNSCKISPGLSSHNTSATISRKTYERLQKFAFIEESSHNMAPINDSNGSSTDNRKKMETFCLGSSHLDDISILEDDDLNLDWLNVKTH